MLYLKILSQIRCNDEKIVIHIFLSIKISDKTKFIFLYLLCIFIIRVSNIGCKIYLFWIHRHKVNSQDFYRDYILS